MILCFFRYGEHALPLKEKASSTLYMSALSILKSSLILMHESSYELFQEYAYVRVEGKSEEVLQAIIDPSSSYCSYRQACQVCACGLPSQRDRCICHPEEALRHDCHLFVRQNI